MKRDTKKQIDSIKDLIRYEKERHRLLLDELSNIGEMMKKVNREEDTKKIAKIHSEMKKS